jgi:cytochrome c biogenesis protein
MVYVSQPGQDGLGLDDGVPQSVHQLDVSTLTQLKGKDGKPTRLLMAPGETMTLPDGAGSVTFEGVKRFAALDIRYDPTKGAALIAALLALAGLTTSLFVRRRRLWVRVGVDADGRTVVEAAGLARGDDAGLALQVQAVLDGVGQPRAETLQKVV